LPKNVKLSVSSMSFILNLDKDRIIFSHHSDERCAFDEKRLRDKFDVIYLGSMGDGWEAAYEKVLSYAKSNNASIAFAPGSHQLGDINDVFLETLKNSKLLMCNMSEARKITDTKQLTREDPSETLRNLKSLGPEMLSITEGNKGAYAVDFSGNIFHIDALVIDSHEKTGAGDAYASGFLAAIIKGKNASEAMVWGSVNAYSVMQETGAQNGLSNENQINEYIVAHNNFKAKKL